MTDTNTSLIEQDERQLRLLGDDQVALAEEELTRNPEFTAERFFSRFPYRYQEIVRLRAEGMSHMGIARIMKCSRNLVAAIERREAQTANVEHLKQSASSTYRHLARLSAERLEEMLLNEEQDLSPKDLGVLIGILEDKAQLLGGGPTSRHELTRGGHEHEELAEYLAALRRSHAERMGLGGESPAKGAPAVDPVAGARTIEVEVSAPTGRAPGLPGAGALEDLGQSGTAPEDLQDEDEEGNN